MRRYRALEHAGPREVPRIPHADAAGAHSAEAAALAVVARGGRLPLHAPAPRTRRTTTRAITSASLDRPPARAWHSARTSSLDQPPGWYLLLVSRLADRSATRSRRQDRAPSPRSPRVVAAYARAPASTRGPLPAHRRRRRCSAVAQPFPGFAAARRGRAGVGRRLRSSSRSPSPSARIATASVLGRCSPPGILRARRLHCGQAAGATALLPVVLLAVFCRSDSLAARLVWPPLAVSGSSSASALLLVVSERPAAGLRTVSIVTHATDRSAARAGGGASNLHRADHVRRPPDCRSACLVIAGAGGIDRRGALCDVSAACSSRSGHGRPAAYAFVLAMHPLSDHHLVFLGVCLALPAGVGAWTVRVRARHGRRRSVAALLVVAFVAAGVYQQRRDMLVRA